MPSDGQACAGGCGRKSNDGFFERGRSRGVSKFDDNYCNMCEDKSPKSPVYQRRRQQEEEDAAQRRQQEEEEDAAQRGQQEEEEDAAQRGQQEEAQPALGSMDEWVQSTFGPSGFDWPVEMCAALSAALAEEELVTAESVAKMDDGDVDDIVQNAGLKKGPAQNFKEGHAALQKAI